MFEAIQECVFQTIMDRIPGQNWMRRPLVESEISFVLKESRKILQKEPFMLELSGEIIIVGDLHGNIDDLLRIFEKMRYPPTTRYLFLGDYIDRGEYGCEVMTLLLSLKILYPNCIYLLRGNHETASLSQFYGFYDEICDKHSIELYESFVETFQQLPLCAVISRKIFCVHGGISPKIRNLSQLRALKKPQEIMGETTYSDLVWSDPCDDIDQFSPSDRGKGYFFGAVALSQFLRENSLDLLVRSHEACDDGICWPYANNTGNVDKCLTVFSNTDYCKSENNAAVLRVSQTLAVSIECFKMMSQKQQRARKVILPYWLTDFTKSKEEKSYQRKERVTSASSPRKTPTATYF